MRVRSRGELVELELGLGLVLSDVAGGDIGLKIVFTLDGIAGHAAKHGELADMVQGVGDGTLEEFFGGGVERVVTGEISVEAAEGGKEALSFVVPGQGLGAMPNAFTLGHGERPIEKVADVGEDLQGRAGGFGGTEIGEGLGGVVEDLSAAIGDGGEAVAQEVASAFGETFHSHKAPCLGEIEGALEGALLSVDLFLELENGVEDGFGARGTAGDVDVHGNDLIAALHDGVIVEDAAGSGASSHGNDPLGLGHLIVKLANDRSHFLGEASGNDHEIGLAGRGTKDFGTETSEVVARGGHGHHLDSAAGETETQRPYGAFAGPVHDLIELREEDAFVLKELAEIVGFGERDAFAEGGGHVCLCDPYLF